MKEDGKVKYKYDEGVKYCRALVSQFKTEERRRVSDNYTFSSQLLCIALGVWTQANNRSM